MAKWREVRVFISSTFRDMHSERDWMVKRVFPELRERLEKYRIHLVDIDLRWGVTEEQAESGGALEVCLNQIDDCRPFFLGLLGERYGWVPTNVPTQLAGKNKFGWIQWDTKKSIIELEILYGVLNDPEMYDHYYFCFRDPAFIADVPAPMQKDLLSEDSESACKLAALKVAIESAALPYPPLKKYRCQYAGLKINWRLARLELNESDQRDLGAVASDGLVDPLEYAGLNPHLQDLVHRFGAVHCDGLQVFGEWVKEWLWESIRRKLELPERPPKLATTAGESLLEEEDFHERFMESRLRIYIGREVVNLALTKYAEGHVKVPCLVTGPSGSGKTAALARFVTEIRGRHPRVVTVAHFVGASPVSTNLRQMLRRLCLILRDKFNLTDTVVRDGQEPQVLPADVPDETNKLTSTFREFLERVPVERPVLLVIDALNQLDETDNAHRLHWLPRQLSDQVKLVVSCISEVGRDGAVLNAMKSRPHEHVAVEPLSNAERHEIIRQVPLLSAKTLNDTQIDLLLANPATENPLYLLVALEELRGFGSFEQLNRRIAGLPHDGDTITELFVQVIERLAGEFDSALVCRLLTMLASARRGLSERELLDLVEGTEVYASASASDLFPVLRQLRPYLQIRGELLDFYHRNLFKAVRKYYLEAEISQKTAHERLAEYFEETPLWLERDAVRRPNARKVDELPWQRIQAGDWNGVERVLCDLRFVEAKCIAGMTYGLVRDYADTMENLPELQQERKAEGERIERLRRYAAELTEYAANPRNSGSDFTEEVTKRRFRLPALLQSSVALNPKACWLKWYVGNMDSRPKLSKASVKGNAPKTKNAKLPNPPDTIPTQKLMLEAELRSVGCRMPFKSTPRVHDLLKFSTFVSLHSNLLTRFPVETIHIAYNYASRGPVVEQATQLLAPSKEVWLRRCFRPAAESENPVSIRTITVAWEKVDELALSLDGTTILSLSREGALHMWDVASGECLGVLTGDKVVAISPDGRTAISRGQADTLRVWEVASGTSLGVLKENTNGATNVTLASGGGTAIAVFQDFNLVVWDTLRGVSRGILIGHAREILALALTPCGRIAVSASGNDLSSNRFPVVGRDICVWDVPSCKCIRVLTGQTKSILDIALTPDGEMAVSASSDRTLLVWDIGRGRLLRALMGHTDVVFAVAVTPDGATAISASGDETLRVWNVSTGECLRVLKGPASSVTKVSLTPDGRTAVSFSLDETIRVWDLVAGELVPTFDVNSNGIQSIRTSLDGTVTISASKDGTIGVWDSLEGHCLRILSGHTCGVRSLALTSDGRIAISACGDYYSDNFYSPAFDKSVRV